MSLLHYIRRKRAKQRQKIPFKRNVFNQISSLVKQYRLKESFLGVLDKIDDYPSSEDLKPVRIRLKTPLDGSLFSLATKDEYSLTMSIINKVDNPYLQFAHSPKEILVCGPLYRLNPNLGPEKLMRYHFETLFLHERTKAKNAKT